MQTAPEKNHLRTGVAALGFLVVLACFPACLCTDLPFFGEKDFSASTSKPENTRLTLKAVFDIHSLSMLPTDLGSRFPYLRFLYCASKMLRPQTSLPQKKRRCAVACANVECLYVQFSSSSPMTFEWLSVFFPGVKELHMNVEGLPVQRDTVSRQGHIEALKNVERLVLASHAGEKAPLPLLENLRLFPKLRVLEFSDEKLGSMFGNMMRSSLKASSIECLSICAIPVSVKLLTDLFTIFPSLKELSICGESLSRLVDAFAGTKPCSSPFQSLFKLGINRLLKGADLDERVADLFPSVSEVEVESLPPHFEAFRPQEGRAHKGIKTARIIDGDVKHSPSFFGFLFPGLESLTMAGCNIDRLFSNDLEHEKTFFARLKHLDISRNRRVLDHLPLQMEALRQSGELLVLSLESLNICGSSYLSAFPHCFFQAFPNIERLRVSDRLFSLHTKDELRTLFKPLTRLKHLDVELFKVYACPDQDFLAGPFGDLRELLGTHLIIQLFVEFSPRPIAEFSRPGPEMG